MAAIYHYIQFSQGFNPATMQQEVAALDAVWIGHLNTRQYNGEWSALPLRSYGGSLTNTIPDAVSTLPFQDTELMLRCPYIKSVVDSLPGIKQSVRLLKLQPGARINEHRDHELAYEYGAVRLHIPIATNPEMEFYTNGERLAMGQGECWYVNFDLPHHIYNGGNSARVHLVLDAYVDDAMEGLFENNTHIQVNKIKKPATYTPAQSELIKQELLRMNTNTANRLAIELNI